MLLNKSNDVLGVPVGTSEPVEQLTHIQFASIYEIMAFADKAEDRELVRWGEFDLRSSYSIKVFFFCNTLLATHSLGYSSVFSASSWKNCMLNCAK